MFLDAMDRLRRAPQAAGRDIISFVLVPAWAREPREDLRQAMDDHANGGLQDPVITHWLNNPDSDPVINRIHGLGFNLSADGHTYVIYVPCYLSGSDGIVDLTYYDTLIGLDATVFPSYYEPWGYTPLESIAFGVPTVTTTLSGFGQWVLSDFANSFASCGVRVVDRDDNNYDKATDEIVDALVQLLNDDAATRAAVSKAAVKTADCAAWGNFIKFYITAFTIALDAAKRREA